MWRYFTGILLMLSGVNATNFSPREPTINIIIADPLPSDISFIGTDFSSQDKYTCVIQNLKLNNEQIFTVINTVSVPATFVSTEQVNCSMNTSGKVMLSSAQFGNLTEPTTQLAYPRQCLRCQDDLTCTATGTGCFVDEQCYDPHASIGQSEICLPDVDPFSGTLLLEQDVVLDSCGHMHVSNLTMNSVDGGYSLAPGVLAPLSSSISLEFFTRFPFGITEERVIAELGPGIKVIQAPNFKLIFELILVNYITRETMDPVRVEISTNTTSLADRLQRMEKRFKKNLRKKLRKFGTWEGVSADDKEAQTEWIQQQMQEKSFSDWAAFLFNPSSAEASFFHNGDRVVVNVGNLTNLHLPTSGQFFVSGETFTCIDLSTQHPKLYRDGQKLKLNDSDCKLIVDAANEGRNGCVDTIEAF